MKCEKPLGMVAIRELEKQQSSISSTPSSTVQPNTAILASRKKQKAMTIAMSPGQQIAMNAFMMYMSGSSLNIFSISVTSSAILTPIKSFVSLPITFQGLGDDVQMAKLIYVFLNLIWLGIGVYKLSSMKLLPTTSADWTGTVVWKDMMETTSIPPSSFW
jgi:ER membrane protein complex subunit 4